MNSSSPASEVPLAPAPWQLTGSGYIVAFRLPADLSEDALFIPESLRGKRKGTVAIMMFVDYAQSDVGPYHELLFIPGVFHFNNSWNRSISRIFVSTWESVVNGNINWGIPKDRCDFNVQYGEQQDIISLTAEDGTNFAELTFRSSRWPRLPGTTRLIPKKLRTLGQHRDGKQFLYMPASNGHAKPATLVNARFNPAYFPDLSQAKVIQCVRITDFAMTFPVADVETIQDK